VSAKGWSAQVRGFEEDVLAVIAAERDVVEGTGHM
jgi:hypothetical protein